MFLKFTLNSSIRRIISSTLVADHYVWNSKNSSNVAILEMSNIIELNLVTGIQIALVTILIEESFTVVEMYQYYKV